MASQVKSAEPVTISYAQLSNSPESLTDAISRAFGSEPDCLGIIVVTDLPKDYPELRERLLLLADRFAALDESVRDKYSDPATHYSFGWSYGKEIMNGVPDTLKGSYYANPTVDSPKVTLAAKAAHREVYGDNIWPSPTEQGIEGFEEAFKALGGFVYGVGCKMAQACQPFASAHLRDQNFSLPTLLSTSQTLKARLLHYFPPTPDPSGAVINDDDEPIDSWCGFHKDHGMLTGLCSALYLAHGKDGEAPKAVPPPNPTSGLYIRTRGGELRKVAIPVDCLAFQTGEALEVATDGRLRATPHCVRVGRGADPTTAVSRETFALFMAPDVDVAVSADETYGQFSKRIIESHYAASEVTAAA